MKIIIIRVIYIARKKLIGACEHHHQRHLKSWVFRRDLKAGRLSLASPISGGSRFHWRGPRERKLRSSKFLIFVWGTCKKPRLADRRRFSLFQQSALIANLSIVNLLDPGGLVLAWERSAENRIGSGRPWTVSSLSPTLRSRTLGTTRVTWRTLQSPGAGLLGL